MRMMRVMRMMWVMSVRMMLMGRVLLRWVAMPVQSLARQTDAANLMAVTHLTHVLLTPATFKSACVYSLRK